MPTTQPALRRRTLGVAACLALLVASCGDDDTGVAAPSTTSTTTTTVAAADVTAYCELSASIDAQDGPPTAEQLQHMKELRPDEIGDEIDAVADALIAADGDFGKIFGDADLAAAVDRINSFEVDNCGKTPDDSGPTDEQIAEPTPGAEVVEITAVDFQFQGVPEQVPAGPVSIGLTNAGESAHEMTVVWLAPDADLDALLASDAEPSPDVAREIGSTHASPGEGPFYVNADLEPGRYAVLCFVPGPNGQPHFMLGMKATFQAV